ncbi:tetratricopeptide repeat protein [Methylobacterium aerolatum]|uniref:Localization factor PodJL n=1 Tax=Methylobacterium aerolatum TaxID=418708 RepID=A0ABU0I1F8_9HYPH|nr:tetratricopeptide repeat protein [Methylobacterium aerolatum]MDQ0447745.1 localization factor PodJL [Methylobacterium aerolatum]GJD34844.1 hypothetical protein FMGBMHLM_1750 [Methylobacterium aerolatum]
MTRKASSQFDGFDPEVIEAARDVANRAGVPLEAWIASVVPQSNVATVGEGRLFDTSPPRSRSPSPTGRSAAAREIARTAAAETDATLNQGFTAIVDRLDGLGRSIEVERRAEQRRLEEIEARIDRALHEGPAQQVTERLSDIERRVAQLGDQVTTPRPPGKRGKVAAEEMREAVDEIRQRQRELAGQTAPAGTVASLHHNLAQSFGTVAAPRRAIGLPNYVAEELQRECARLSDAVSALPTASEAAALEKAVAALSHEIDAQRADVAGIDLASLATPIETIGTRIERIVAETSTYDDVLADLRHLAGRLDVAAAFDDASVEGTALHTLTKAHAEIQAKAALLAAPERLNRLVPTVQGLRYTVAPTFAVDQDEVRALLDGAEAPEAHIAVDAVCRDIEGAVARIRSLRAEAQAAAEFAAAAAAEAAAASLAAAATPATEFGANDVATLHEMLHNLAEKVDRVGERVGNEGLDALERQVMTLVHKIETPHALDPALTSLERTMADLTQQVEALRAVAPNEESIERATRTAVTETLKSVSFNAGGSGGGDVGLLRDSLADMQARQIASDERLGLKLEGVQSALDRLADRLGSSERAAASTAPSLDERLMASTSVEAARPALRATMPDVGDTPRTDPFVEALLVSSPGEPAPAPAPASVAAPAPPKKAEPAATDADIKTSFIAAARRAAQAAQAELAAEGSADGQSRTRPSVGQADRGEEIKVAVAKSAAVAPTDKASSGDDAWPEKSWLDKAIGAKGVTAKTPVGKGAAGKSAKGAEPKSVTVKTMDSAFDIKITDTKAADARIADVKVAEARTARSGAERNRKPLLLGLAAVVLSLGAIGLRSSGDDPLPQLAAAPESAPQQTAQPEKIQEAQRAAEAPAAPAATDMQKTAGNTAPTDQNAGQAPAAKAPEAPPAPAKVSLPSIAGMSGLAGDLANLPPAYERLKQAALAGEGNAVWELAVRLGDGRGMPRDLALAAKVFERIATAGYAPAQYKLGALYEKGTGLTRDLAQAKLWYGRAAEQGHARAMHNLGVIYAENPGPNGKPDFVSAATWFRQGAEHGVKDSQYNIAVLYARGLGLTQDLVQSYAWFNAAAAQGDDDAGKKRDDVGSKLSAPDLARAKSLAASFKPRKLDPFVNEPLAFPDGSAAMSLMGAPAPSTAGFVQPGRKAI